MPLPMLAPVDITPVPLPQPVPAPAQIGETSDAAKRVLAVDLQQIEQYVRDQLIIEAEESKSGEFYE